MATTQTEEATDNKPESAGADTAGKSQIVELSTESFKAFCEDISAMFSINMRSNKLGVSIVKTEALQRHFKNLVAITSCEATGALEGTFQIIFSREGLFTLAGAISMPAEMTSLLEKCIGPEQTMKNIKEGSIKEAEAVSDTVAEACNLLIGSWDRIFRENSEGHKHLLQTNTFIGDPWKNPKEIIGIGSDDEIVFTSYKIMISSYPAFLCGAIFPKSILAKTDIEAIEVEQKARAEAEKKAKAKAAEEAKAEVEEKAKGEAEEKPKDKTEEKAKAKAEEKAKAEAEVEEKVEAEEEPKAEAEAEEKAETEEEPKAETEVEEKAETEEVPKAEAEVEEIAEPEEEPKAEAQAEEKTETEEEPKAEAESEEKAETEEEPKAEAQAEEIADTEEEPKAEAQAEEIADTEEEPKAETQAEEIADTEEEPKAETEVEEKAEAEEEPKAEAEVEEKAETEEEPIAEAKEEPQAENEVEEIAETEEEPKAETEVEEKTETEEEPKAEAEAEEIAETEKQPKTKVEAGESQILELSTESFKAFCHDISTMFNIGMKCEKQEEAATVKIEALQERFKNLVSITSCKASGALEGTFQIIFSREGLFTLAGAISMPAQMTSMLEQCVGPEQTMKNIKSGSLKEAEGESDTIAEACNLLIGSWDRIFREGLEGHEHLLQANNFIGDPWDNPKEKIAMASDEELVFAPHKITISSFPAFDCGVIFPKTIFSEAEEKAKAEAEEKVKAEAEEKAKAEAEEKAKAEAEAEEKAKAEEEEKVKAEAEEKAKAEVEEKAEAEEEPKEEEEVEEKAEAVEEPKEEAEAEEKAEAETEAKAEIDEKTSAPDQSQEPPKGKVSETIQKMSQSPATLPGESGKATIANIGVEACATDIMQKEVVWATSEECVQQAMTKMQQQDSGYIMIGKDGVLEGIVSKSDITGATSVYLRPIFAKWYGPLDDATLQIKLKWIMSRPVRTIKPETPLATIIENICRFGGRGLPVVGEEGKVQGLVTVFDIFRTLLNTSENVSAVGKTAEAPALV